MLFLAAITSSISMYQPSLAFFEESLGISRKRGTTFLVTICLIGSFLVMYYSKGLEFLDTIDSWVGTFFIFILAGFQIIFFSWVFGLERGWHELHNGARIQIPTFFKIVLKWIAPLYLIIVFSAFCVQNLPDWIQSVIDSPTRQGAMLLLAIVALILIGCVFIGEKRWRREGIDINDDQPLVD